MQAMPIIERFNVSEHAGHSVLPGGIGRSIDTLHLESPKETFHGGVVIPRPDAIHTDHEAVLS